MILGVNTEITDAVTAAIAAYDVRAVQALLLKNGDNIPVKNKGLILVKMAGFNKLLDQSRRFEIITHLLSQNSDEFSEEKILGFKVAARAGNVDILALLDGHCSEKLSNPDLEEAFVGAINDGLEVGAMQYLLKKYGKRLSSESKALALVKTASYFKFVEPARRLAVVCHLLSEEAENLSTDAKIASFKGAAMQGDISLLELLEPHCRGKITPEDINALFVAPSRSLEKNRYLLQKFGTILTPKNKALVLVAVAGICKFLDQQLRLQIVEQLLTQYGSEIGLEDKLLALKTAEKQKDVEMIDLFKKHCSEIFPTENLVFSTLSEPASDVASTGVLNESLKKCKI